MEKTNTCGKALLYCLLVAWLSYVCIACSQRTEEDVERMRALKKTYGKRYSFSFDGERFLSVKPKKNAPVNKDELIEIYKAFFLDKGGNPRESSIYTHLMNYYGPRHDFHQLEYYPSEDCVKIRDSDRYRGKREPLTARNVVEFWGRQFKRLFD